MVGRDGILGAPPGVTSSAGGSGNRHRPVELENTPAPQNQISNFSHKVEFHILRREIPNHGYVGVRYFHYNRVENPEEKLEMAVLHLNGRAESWYFSFHLSKSVVKWGEFVEEICKRFSDSINSTMNLLGEFKKLEQTGTVNE